MKVITVLSLLLAMVASDPTVTTMTISELSTAIETKKDPLMERYFEDALNQIMDNLFNGNDDFSRITIPPPSGAATWTIEELRKEVQNIEESINEFNDDYISAVIRAYGIYKQKDTVGEVENVIQVVIPAMDISTWTMADLNTALSNKTTKAELIPYLEKAIADLKKQSGDDVIEGTISMVTPVGLIPQKIKKSISKKKNKKAF